MSSNSTTIEPGGARRAMREEGRDVRRPGPALPAPDFGPVDTMHGWLVTGVVALIALVTRLYALGSATDGGTPIFDEKHYAPQSFQISQLGIEENPGYGLVVHPPVAKQIQSIGGFLFGYTPMGWRITAALAGVLVIVLIVRMTRRLTRSTLLGGIAGLLLACDGVLFVTSRVGMLDIYQVLFVTAAAACLLVDRDRMRLRMHSAALAGRVNPKRPGPAMGLAWFYFLAALFVAACVVALVALGWSLTGVLAVIGLVAAFVAVSIYLLRASDFGRLPVTDLGPRLGFRWWRFGAGLMLGLAMGTKWSGLYYVAFFGVMALAFDIALRSRYKVRAPLLGALTRDSVPAFASLVLWPAVVYVMSWLPWFRDENAVYRHVVGTKVDADSVLSFLPDSVQSWIYYQSSVMDFHSSLTNSAGNMHPWESKPWVWPMSLRPMLYYMEQGPEVSGCGQNSCVQAIMLNGTPAMWWLAIPVLGFALWRAVFSRDGRYAFALVGYCAGIVPWFFMLDRQMYFFYGALLIPFFVIMLALILGEISGVLRAGRTPSAVQRAEELEKQALARAQSGTGVRAMIAGLSRRQTVGFAILAVYVALVVANFVYMWPVLVGQPITQLAWQNQQWLPSWT